jgi:ferrous iron transport protein B
MDEARRHNLQIEERRLARDLGVPVVPTAARYGQGLAQLLQTISEVATGQTVCRPHRLQNEPPALRRAVAQLVGQIETVFPGLPNARWVALRLLDGDQRIMDAVRSGELGHLNPVASEQTPDQRLSREAVK